jgi:ribosomal silencing factor RsfS
MFGAMRFATAIGETSIYRVNDSKAVHVLHISKKKKDELYKYFIICFTILQ